MRASSIFKYTFVIQHPLILALLKIKMNLVFTFLSINATYANIIRSEALKIISWVSIAQTASGYHDLTTHYRSKSWYDVGKSQLPVGTGNLSKNEMVSVVTHGGGCEQDLDLRLYALH